MIEYNLDTEHSILHVQPKICDRAGRLRETREGLRIGYPALSGDARAEAVGERQPEAGWIGGPAETTAAVHQHRPVCLRRLRMPQHKWTKIAVTINIRYRRSGLRIS